MKTSLKSDLQKHIIAFVHKSAQGTDWPEHYCAPNLAELMTNAAEAVFDASFAGGKEAEENLSPQATGGRP